MIKSGDRISVAIQNALVSFAAYLVGCYFTASFHTRSSSIGDCSASRGIPKHLEIGGAPSAWNVDRSDAKRFLPLSLSFEACRNGDVRPAYRFMCQMVGVPDHGRLAAITVALVMMIFERQFQIVSVRKCGAALHRIGYRCGTAVLAVLFGPRRRRPRNELSPIAVDVHLRNSLLHERSRFT